MAIRARRFDSLDRDFNVATESFQSVKNIVGETLNGINQTVGEVTAPIKEMIGEFKKVKDEALDVALDVIKAATRFADDVYGTFTDLAKVPEQLVGDFLKNILGDNVSSGTLAKLTSAIKTCQKNAAGRSLGISGKIKMPKCGGFSYATRDCPTNKTGTTLDGLLGLGNGITGAVNALTNALNKILSLATLGFSADLCGVFAAVTKGITDKGVLTKASGVLLNAEGALGNTKAVFDISKSLSGINAVAQFPSTVKNIAQNMKAPLNLAKKTVDQFATSVDMALDAIDPLYKKASDGLNSVAKLGAKNGVVDKALTQLGNDLPISVSNLTTPIKTTMSSVSQVYSQGKSALDGLSKSLKF